MKNNVKERVKNDVKKYVGGREVAGAVPDETNRLLDNRKLRMIHRAQLRDSSQSIPANIREGMGRKPGPHRHQAYRIALAVHILNTLVGD